MRLIPWYHYPQTELVRFAPVDFFPPKPDFEKLKTICIGTKTRTIGDALMLSSLPRKLKQRYPGLRVLTYPRGFNPVVFWNNPYVDGVTWFPGALYGDDCNEGSGQLIELKDRFFGVPVECPRPEIYLTEQELAWGKEFADSVGTPSRRKLPIVVIHPFGHNFTRVLNPEVWGSFVEKHGQRCRIVQVGVQGQVAVKGCDAHFLAPKKRAAARQLFALIHRAERLIGVDSGPMHIARAFGVRPLIVTDGADPKDIFERRHKGPYFLYKNWNRAFLYEDQEHLYVPPLSPEQMIARMGEFLEDLPVSR